MHLNKGGAGKNLSARFSCQCAFIAWLHHGSNWFHVWLESAASVLLSSAYVIVNPTPKRLFLQHRKSFEKSDEGKSLITRSTLPSVYISGIIMGLKRSVRLFWILPSARLCMIAFNFSPPSDAMNWKILEHMLRHTSSLQLLVNTFGKREKRFYLAFYYD